MKLSEEAEAKRLIMMQADIPDIAIKCNLPQDPPYEDDHPLATCECAWDKRKAVCLDASTAEAEVASETMEARAFAWCTKEQYEPRMLGKRCCSTHELFGGSLAQWLTNSNGSAVDMTLTRPPTLVTFSPTPSPTKTGDTYGPTITSDTVNKATQGLITEEERRADSRYDNSMYDDEGQSASWKADSLGGLKLFPTVMPKNDENITIDDLIEVVKKVKLETEDEDKRISSAQTALDARTKSPVTTSPTTRAPSTQNPTPAPTHSPVTRAPTASCPGPIYDQLSNHGAKSKGDEFGSKTSCPSLYQCSQRCTKEPECHSFSYSKSKKICSKFKAVEPPKDASVKGYSDDVFCAKSCPSGYEVFSPSATGRRRTLLESASESESANTPTAAGKAPTAAKPAAPTTKEPTTKKPTQNPTTKEPTASPTTAMPTSSPTWGPGDQFGGGPNNVAAGIEACGEACSKEKLCVSMEYNPVTKNCFRYRKGDEPVQPTSADFIMCKNLFLPPITYAPTDSPTTAKPSVAPSKGPTGSPTTAKPTISPTRAPSTTSPTTDPLALKPGMSNREIEAVIKRLKVVTEEHQIRINEIDRFLKGSHVDSPTNAATPTHFDIKYQNSIRAAKGLPPLTESPVSAAPTYSL